MVLGKSRQPLLEDSELFLSTLAKTLWMETSFCLHRTAQHKKRMIKIHALSGF
jgi:hypothetical protein